MPNPGENPNTPDPNEPAATPGAAPPGAEPAATPGATPPTDLDKFYRDAYNKGIAKGAERGDGEFKKQFAEKFGTDNLDQAAQEFADFKARKAAPPSLPAETIQKMETLAAENKTLKDAQAQAEIKNKRDQTKTEILAAVNKENPITDGAGEMIRDLIFNNYEIRDGKVFKIGEETPHFSKDNQLATLQSIIAEYKTGEHHYAFKKGTEYEHANTPREGGLTNYMFKDNDYYTPGFMDAVKKSGQWTNVLDGKPIDLTRLGVDLRNFGINI